MRDAAGSVQIYSDAVHLLEREHELRALEEAFASAAGRHGGGIAVTRESGAGRSSLIAAAVRVAHGLRSLRGQCEALSTALLGLA